MPLTRGLLFTMLAAFAASLGAGVARAQTLPYQNQSLSFDERVSDLVGRMTLEEKVQQMKDVAPPIPRLGVPEYNWWNEALHGVARSGLATVFPQAIGMAATWNDDLMFRLATVISDEARAKHEQYLRENSHQRYQGLTFWSPNINIFRDPRWGRGQETYGEDPFLTGKLGVQFIRGLQGDDPKYFKTVATVKHFAVHSGPEPERHSFDAVVSERDLRETYLPHFEMGIREGKAYSLMCAYNRIDGKAACGSDMLIKNILRDEWKFPGYIVSDCGAIDDIYLRHKVAPTAAAAAALAVKTGTDLDCGRVYPNLVDAVKQGLITEKEIDVSLKRLFLARFKLGMFDSTSRVKWAQIPFSVVDQPANRALATRVARESMVLLKNQGNILPLKKTLKTIAVIGPNSDQTQMLLGNYNGIPKDPITPLRGIREKLPNAKVLYARGSDLADGFPVLDRVPPSALRDARRQARAEGRVLLDGRGRGNASGYCDGLRDQRRLEGRRAAQGNERRRLRRAMDRHFPSTADGRLPSRAHRHDQVRALSRRQPRHAIVLSDARRRISGSAPQSDRADAAPGRPRLQDSRDRPRDLRRSELAASLVDAARGACRRG